jgi:hypothetical protein
MRDGGATCAARCGNDGPRRLRNMWRLASFFRHAPLAQLAEQLTLNQ